MTNRKSVTREMRKMIHNQKIRKNVTKMYIEYDEEEEKDCLHIEFKENTMVNLYDYTISNSTGIHITSTIEKDMNGWLEEVYMPLEDYPAEDQKELLARA